MRPLSNFVVAACAALGAPLALQAQIVAPAKSPKAALVGCSWQEIGRFPKLAPRSLAVGRDGALLLAADDLTDVAHPMLVVIRQPAPGASWEGVDRFRPAGADSSGAYALHVDDDGNVFVLGWQTTTGRQELILRRSLNAGLAGTWESGEQTWPSAGGGGALGSDRDGRIYVAYGFADRSGVGWRVESALRGIGAFAAEDEVTFEGALGAAPQDFERKADGTLVIAGQLDGEPDQWVVRARAQRGGAVGLWSTIDRFELTKNSYGLAPRAIVSTNDGRLLVAGLGVRGGGSDDYEWLERWQNARGKWKTVAYQLANGYNSFAQDAAATRNGIAVLGVGTTPTGSNLLLRESTDGGSHWQTAFQLAGIANPWTARLAVSAASAAVSASLADAAVVFGCNR